jgi:hypothetical protein
MLHSIYVKNWFIISTHPRTCMWGGGGMRWRRRRKWRRAKNLLQVADKRQPYNSELNIYFLYHHLRIPCFQEKQHKPTFLHYRHPPVYCKISIWHMENSHLYCIFIHFIKILFHIVYNKRL